MSDIADMNIILCVLDIASTLVRLRPARHRVKFVRRGMLQPVDAQAGEE